MNKCLLIIPYFGKFHNYFSLFLDSCRYNAAFEWLIFTDDRGEYNYPANVHVQYIEFEHFCNQVQKKFDFEISLPRPYKLCDYKVAYGYLFEEYLQGYSHWGYCDCDLLFGKLDNFITESMMNEYDKLFTVGHLCIYKNNFENNRMFMKSIYGKEYYKLIFSNERSFAFDELIINEIFEKYKKKMFTLDLSANISVYSHRFRIVKRIWDVQRYFTEQYIPSVFFWKKGEIIRVMCSEDDGKYKICKFPYIHLQHRKMKIKVDESKRLCIQIRANSFVDADDNMEISDILKLKKWEFDVKNIISCSYVNVKWKVKQKMGHIFPGKFTRGNM